MLLEALDTGGVGPLPADWHEMSKGKGSIYPIATAPGGTILMVAATLAKRRWAKFARFFLGVCIRSGHVHRKACPAGAAACALFCGRRKRSDSEPCRPIDEHFSEPRCTAENYRALRQPVWSVQVKGRHLIVDDLDDTCHFFSLVSTNITIRK